MSAAQFRRVVVGVCALLAVSTAGFAQSPLDGYDPGANGTVRALAVQADGKVLVGGSFTMLGGGGTGTTTRNRLGRLKVDGSLDTSFDPGVNGDVYAIAVQTNGSILIGGSFSMIGGGGTGVNARTAIARLLADGSFDATFSDPGVNLAVRAIAIEPGGRIVLAGDFTGGVKRLESTGLADATFQTVGANNSVNALALQADGKIVVVGSFTTLDSGVATRNRIGRLNANGSLDTGFNPGADAAVNAVAIQPDGKIVVGGTFTMLGGGGAGSTPRLALGRINRNGTLDSSFNSGMIPEVDALSIQTDGRILVGGAGGSPRLFRVNPNGAPDSFNPGVDTDVKALAVQQDAKIVAGGSFTMLGGGGSGTTTRNRIGRLYPDGSLDATFDPGASPFGAGGYVLGVAVQADGQILATGGIEQMGGGGQGNTPRNQAGRLRPDGSLDAFNPPAPTAQIDAPVIQPDQKFFLIGTNGTSRYNANGSPDNTFTPFGPRPTGMIVLPDGKLLIFGNFSSVNGNYIARLEADGSFDHTFNPGANNQIQTAAVQPDGKIVVGGSFTMIGGGGTGNTARSRIARLEANGDVDSSFDPGANGGVLSLTLQPDGKILVGGVFGLIGNGGTGSVDRTSFARLNGDGSVDLPFNPVLNGTFIDSSVLQADGKILIAGGFSSVQGGHTNARTLARLNPSGSPDASFDGGTAGSEGNIGGVAMQNDGKVLVVGTIASLKGGGSGTILRSKIGRFTNTDAATDALATTTSTVTWMRGGTAPEVWRTTFESSADGVSYTPLGNGTRIAGGWQLAGQNFPVNQNVFIRARGFTSTAYQNSSGSVHESVREVYLPAAPIVITGVATGIDSWVATLNGTANPLNSPTTAYFEYGLDGTYGTATPTQNLGSGLGAVSIGGGALTGLTCNTVYHFRAVATNEAGTTLGQDAMFTTAVCPPPTVTTGVGSSLTRTTATLNGTANPNGLAATGRFEYGPTNTYGTQTPPQPLGSGLVAVTIPAAAIGGLTCGSTYHFRASATNATGTGVGNDTSFGTTACAPTAATSVLTRTSTSLTIHVVVSKVGLFGSTLVNAAVEYGPTPAYGTTTTLHCAGVPTPCTFDEPIGGLTPSTAYYFRVVGSDENGAFMAGAGVGWTCGAAGCGVFSDASLTAGTTTIKAIHLLELRARINELEYKHGLTITVWSQALTPQTTVIQRVHILELRSALNAVYSALMQPPPVFSDDPLPTFTPVKALHVTQLRAAIVTAEPF